MAHFEFQVLLFSLTNALAVIQPLVNDVMGDMPNPFVLQYNEIFSLSAGTHALCSPGAATLFVNAEKRIFHTQFCSWGSSFRQMRSKQIYVYKGCYQVAIS